MKAIFKKNWHHDMKTSVAMKQKHLLFGRNIMAHLHKILKCRDITLLKKNLHIFKTIVLAETDVCKTHDSLTICF